MQRRLLSLWYPNFTKSPALKTDGGGRDEAALERLALWCQAFTPLTAVDPPDGILLDITGCAHLFGGEAGLCARLEAALPGVRLAIADTAAAAWALARYRGNTLDDLPVAALRLTDSVIARMRRLGIRRIGELVRLSRAEVRAGFGADTLLKLDRLLGRAPEVARFVAEPPEWRVVEYHAEALLAPAQLQAVLARLAASLCAALDAAERGMVGLLAAYHRVDASVVEDRIGFAAPTRDGAHVVRLLTERLQTIDPGFGVEAVVLTAEAAPLALVQVGLDQAAAPRYAQTIDRLMGDRLMGRVRLSRFAPEDTHIPELAAHRVPVTAAAAAFPAIMYPRPVRLFERPEPIMVVAPVPDDPPRLMRWRGASHPVARATGPERIGRDWWRHDVPDGRPEDERIRDYYVIETAAGERFWVFRAGVHGGVAAPQWFLHGVF